MKRTRLTGLLGAVFAVLAAGPSPAKEVALRRSNPNEMTIPRVVTVGIPFPVGELSEADAAGVAIVGPDGRPVPAQFAVQSLWWLRGGSVQVLQVSFLADPAVAEYRLVYGEGAPKPAAGPVRAARDGDTITIENGALRAVMNARSLRLFEEVRFDANRDGKYDDAERVLGPGGVSVGDFSAAAMPPEKVEVEEAGPVRAVVMFRGRHGRTDGQTRLEYVLRVYAEANDPSLRLDYTFMQNDKVPFADAPHVALDFGLPPGGRRAVFGVFEAEQAPPPEAQPAPAAAAPAANAAPPAPAPPPEDAVFDLKPGDVLRLTQTGPEQPLKPYVMKADAKANEWLLKVLEERKKWRSPEEDGLWERDERRKAWDADWSLADAKARHAAKAAGWLRIEPADKPWALTAGVRWMWQLHPKAFEVWPDGLRVFLYPPLPRPLHLQVGMAKTHTVFLAFHDRGDAGRGRQVERAVDAPLLYFPSPEWMCGSKVWGALWVRQPGKFRLFEQRLERDIVSYANITPKRGGDTLYGMMNYGDFLYSQGQFINMETAHDYGVFVQFLRTGDRKFYDIFERQVLHFRDVDTSHGGLDKGQWDYGQWVMPGYIPEALAAECARDDKLREKMFYYLGDQPPHAGGIRRHSYYHSQNAALNPALPWTQAPEKREKHYSGTVAVSGHGWNVGTIAHYMITGDRYSLDTAHLTGDYILTYSRGSGWGRDNWKYIDLVHLYRATGRKEYLDQTVQAVDFFYEHRNEVVPKVKEQAERLMSPYYTIGQFIREFHQLSGDPEVGRKFVEMISIWLDAVDKTKVETSCGKVFEYIRDFKDSRCHGDFADLAYCHLLTGDRSFVDRGLDSFRLYMRHAYHSPVYFEAPFTLTQLDRLGIDPLDEPLPTASLGTGAMYVVKEKDRDLAVFFSQSMGYRGDVKAQEGWARLVDPEGKVVAEKAITAGGLDAYSLRAPKDAPAGVYKIETKTAGLTLYLACDQPLLPQPPAANP
jgi:hypothetical protein